jgi:hypothetical protein
MYACATADTALERLVTIVARNLSCSRRRSSSLTLLACHWCWSDVTAFPAKLTAFPAKLRDSLWFRSRESWFAAIVSCTPAKLCVNIRRIPWAEWLLVREFPVAWPETPERLYPLLDAPLSGSAASCASRACA